jgi:hypothetical protein
MLRSVVFILVLIIGLAVPAMAQQKADFPKEGKYDVTNCWSGTANGIAFSKPYSAASYELTGTSRSNPPGGFLDMVSFRCVGFSNTIDGKSSGMNMCEAFDMEGDKVLIKNIIEFPKETSEALAGTGKYEGIVRTGVSNFLGTFPTAKPGTFQGCNNSTGSYKMKLEATGTTTPPATTPSK